MQSAHPAVGSSLSVHKTGKQPCVGLIQLLLCVQGAPTHAQNRVLAMTRIAPCRATAIREGSLHATMQIYLYHKLFSVSTELAKILPFDEKFVAYLVTFSPLRSRQKQSSPTLAGRRAVLDFEGLGEDFQARLAVKNAT